MSDSFKSCKISKYYTTKHKNYFKIYDHIFKKYIGKKIILVEIGVLNGGSLFMWRNFFNGNAEIIGVDLNPNAKKSGKNMGLKFLLATSLIQIFGKIFIRKFDLIIYQI